MTVKVYEYHDLIKENEKLKQKVARLEEEIARLKGLASNSEEPVV